MEIVVMTVATTIDEQPETSAIHLKSPAHYFPCTNSCFSFFRLSTKLMGIFNVFATTSAGVSASHCVREISATRSLL